MPNYAVNDSPKLLLVEDDPTMAAVCQSYLREQSYQLSCVADGNSALQLLQQQSFDGVLLDLSLPDVNGLDILKSISRDQQPTEVIITTGDCSMNTAIEAMKLGARDYLVKPFDQERLLTTLKNTFEHQQLKRIVDTYHNEIDRRQFHGFIGSSLAMQRVYQVIDSAADSKATIFITGESGTGKEVCAEAIHRHSQRSKAPFIALNCAAIPKDLIESELFGHVKGAFTGAATEREGAAKAAQGGTLFLDEICEMELALQTKLLRFLQTGTLQKVGSDKTEQVDVRIVCATNRDPQVEVQAGNFREDLFYRLHVLPIHLPALRERESDVIEIASAFLSQYSAEEQKAFQGFDAECEYVLGRYEWPGNVRQLQNVIRNIVVLNNAEQVTAAMLPAPLDSLPTLSGGPSAERMPPSSLNSAPVAAVRALEMPPKTVAFNATEQDLQQLIRPIAELERQAIEQAIELCQGNIPKAAHYLEISAATIYRKRNSWKQSSG